MTSKEKVPASAATLTGTAETGTACRLVTTSNDQCIAKGTGGQDKIAGLLLAGAENGILLRDLSRIVGEDPRVIRRRIQGERKAGALILSDCKNGYFLPSSEYEIRRFIRSMSMRAAEIAEVSRAAEDALAAMTGQETLEGW